MSKQTYQERHNGTKLERYEWTRIWFEDTYDTQAKRVAYIGDSISEGTHQSANQLPDRKYIFNGFATSKAVDHPAYLESVMMFLSEHTSMDAIIINNGLHGWHLTEEEYGKYYGSILQNLRQKYPETPMWIVLTTDISEANECCSRVAERNLQAVAIANSLDLPVIDLNTASRKITHLRRGDGVHFESDGYEALARQIISVLDEVLK